MLLVHKCLKNLLSSGSRIIQCRPYSTPKRFYKKTGVIHGDGWFEITLDHRKLKTPKGEIFRVQNELLALGVAAEWDAQKREIQRSTMHLSALCSTSQDNPHKLTKENAVEYITNFLETDTVLFHSRADDLNALQEREWGAVLDWFRKRFEVVIEPTKDIVNPDVPEETKQVIKKHLISYSLDSLHGFLYAVESLKSVILTLCCVERKLTVAQAVLLTRLEEEYQTDIWGRVEWAHDINQIDLQSRVAAAVIFIQLTSMSEHTKSKLISVV